ncbi:prephenate dehydrogenase [Rubricoccus marinus]|uniref:Prephenate dehydrogenase n=1 Tax=Rubricoccus marinus TaxID=716817 RepID=A0A259TWB0_9BACT|nr:prephenate dehydrogenase [Rubricoccus marinus]OZC01986.1 hypothetical protein BSZ36_02710 [Rubricoccus marinus]
MNRIALIGTGLIGGSLGLAIRARHPETEVACFDASGDEAALALARGAATHIAPSAREAASGAELVVLAVPTGAVAEVLREIAPVLAPGTVVTDVASVKGPVVRAAREVLPPQVTFVGGHPMAGAEKGGMAHADALLFENAVYVLTPEAPGEAEGAAQTQGVGYTLPIPPSPFDRCPIPPEALWLVEAAGARAVRMDADRHDAVVASVSHLPQLLAVALVQHAAQTGDDALALAAGGFRDMTRIASSPFGMWGDILGANRDAVLGALDAFARGLGDLRAAVSAGATPDLREAFGQAAGVRDAIPSHSKGFLAPLAEVTLWAEDRVGFLAGVTGALSDAGLNIKDMELLRVREGAGGAFRLAFADGATADAAIGVLRARGLRAERR